MPECTEPPVKECPVCGLVSPPEAERCDCGWDFTTSQMAQSYLPSPKSRVASTAVHLAVSFVAVIVLKMIASLVVAIFTTR